jgi:hypothetical protein
MAPVIDAWERIDLLSCRQPRNAWVASQLPLLRALVSIPRVPVTAIRTALAPLGALAPATFCATTEPCRASSLSGMAPSAPSGAIAMAVQMVFPSAPSELLLAGALSGLAAAGSGVGGLMVLTAAGVLPVSLAALAALALPGAGGRTILSAAGVRIGYRQAKAGFAVRTAGIAGFARPGAAPLGVVRSGSLLVICPGHCLSSVRER